MSSQPSYWTLDGAIDTLVTGLNARAGLAGVQISDEWPGDAEQELESIWVGDADSSEEVAGMKAGPIDNTENYTIYLWVDVKTPGKRTKAARDRCTVLVGEVMRHIAENKRLDTGGNKVVMARIGGWRYRPYVQDDGRAVACRIAVRVTGRR